MGWFICLFEQMQKATIGSVINQSPVTANESHVPYLALSCVEKCSVLLKAVFVAI
jgi:hypothetical protein